MGVLQELKKDVASLEGIVGNTDTHHQRLENIKTSRPEQVHVDDIIDIHEKISPVKTVSQKYAEQTPKHPLIKSMYTAGVQQLEQLVSSANMLEFVLYETVKTLVQAITKDFYHWAKKVVKGHAPHHRTSLDTCTKLYA